MPAKTFVVGFVCGTAFTLIVVLALIPFIAEKESASPLLYSPRPAFNGMLEARPLLIPAANLDSYDGLREIEKIARSTEKITDKLDDIADTISRLSRPLEKIADWRLGK
jgi:hypothetical protein